MYKEKYEMLKESEKTGADLSPIDFSFIDWYEEEAVKYTPQKVTHNSDYTKCKNEIMPFIDSPKVWMHNAIEEILKKYFL